MNPKRRVRFSAVLVAAALLLVACGGNDDDAAPVPTATEAPPATVQPTATEVPPATVQPTATEAPPATVQPTATEAPTPVPETAPVSFDGFSAGTLPELADGLLVPGFSGTAMDGTSFEWTPGSAPTVIVFLAHWCPACQNEVAEMTHWLDEGNQLPKGVEFFGISTLVNPERDNYPPSQWLREEGWPFPVLLDDPDSTMSAVFRLSGTPFWAIINADGALASRGSGQIPPDDLAGLFDQLLAPTEG